MSGPTQWKIGPHTLLFEPPDLLRIHYQGQLTLDQAAVLVERYRELTLSRPLFILGDMSDAAPLQPEVQRYLGENVRPEWFRISIYFGTRLVHKALIKGIVLATQLSATAPLQATEDVMADIHYVATRGEAEQLLRELRARLPPDKV